MTYVYVCGDFMCLLVRGDELFLFEVEINVCGLLLTSRLLFELACSSLVRR
jgi:hypothetical protein